MKKEFTASEGQIKAWKKKHGTVHEITVKKGDKEFRCFLKDPYNDINLISSAMAIKDNPMKRNLYILDNLWIDGAEEFKNDNQVRISGGIEALGLVEFLESSVKKH
jgi:hypothetical protein